MNITNSPNIILIGMPGAGKSTVGVLLAKALSWGFIDTDLVVQASEGRRLQEILDTEGLDAFRSIEEKHVLSLTAKRVVIATGGSVPYSDAAMAHLKRVGQAVYLDVPLDELRARLRNMDSRGIVMTPGQDLTDLFRERTKLYERYADLRIDCDGKGHDEIVGAILTALGEAG